MPEALPRISAAPAARPVFAARFTRREITSVRGELSKHAAEVGLTGERLHDFVLAVNEIVTNAVVHGGGHGELRLWTIGQTVGCDVVDQGPHAGDGHSGDQSESPQPESPQPESPQPESPQPESPQPESPQSESPQVPETVDVETVDVLDERGGRGLMLARLLVDSLDMQTSPQGTSVRLISVR